jgi:hypothetical protein
MCSILTVEEEDENDEEMSEVNHSKTKNIDQDKENENENDNEPVSEYTGSFYEDINVPHSPDVPIPSSSLISNPSPRRRASVIYK